MEKTGNDGFGRVFVSGLLLVFTTALVTWVLTRNAQAPAPVVAPAVKVAQQAPCPPAVTPVAPILVESVPKAALNTVAFESLWEQGGAGYQKKVAALADQYANEMDAKCQKADFNIAPAVAAYGGYVPHGQTSALAVLVKAQVQAMACEKMNGARAAAILDS